MSINHAHIGVERRSGSLRSHPVKRMHKDDRAKKYHNLCLTKSEKSKYTQPYKTTEAVRKFFGKTTIKQGISCPIDSDGYINIDLDKSEGLKGIRLKFTRTEGRTKRKVALQINKK